MTALRALLIVLPLALAGCSLGVSVQVDAISDKAAPAGQRYVMRSGMPAVKETDLYFREFSGYFRKAMADRGFQEAASSGAADVVVYLSYGLSDGRTMQYAYTTPVYDLVGGQTVTLEETKTDDLGKTTTTTSKLRIPVTHQIVARDVHYGSYTLYTAYAMLEARRPGAAPEEPAQWKTSVQSTGSSNDLRSLMPVLAAASAPYLGANTGKAVTINLRESDPKVQQIRGAAGQ